jgi:GNAT superfamily N-acetyltransferase
MKNELDIQVIRKQVLSASQYEEVLELCTGIFKFDFRPLLESFDDATHIVGYLGEKLVCHALWVTRWLQTPGLSPWRTAYVEAVATDERYRRRGFATLVMQRLAEEIRGYDLGGLSTLAPDFYNRFGWVSWRGPLYIRKDDQLIQTPKDSVMVLKLPGNPEIDIDKPLSAEWREGALW